MKTDLPADVTRILNGLGADDRRAVSDLLPIVYSDLRRLADSFFRRERSDHTLQPTALVHEAYLRLVQGQDGRWQNREHFFRSAAVVMRHILLRHARDHGRQKRGGGREKVQLQEEHATDPGPDIDLIGLDEALNRLATLDPRQAEMVELRFFAGLSMEEIAEVMKLSKRTVEEDWTLAKAWLWREMCR